MCPEVVVDGEIGMHRNMEKLIGAGVKKDETF